MMKKIMILGASILQLPAIKKAKKMGLEVIAVDMNKDAIGFKEDGIICENISTIDIPEIIKIAKIHKIDGIMTLASDMPIRTVAAVAKELNIVGVSENTAINATNKAVMRECLKLQNVPIPQFYRVSNEEEYLNIIKKFKNKCIVKPADNSGSRGINLLSNLNDKDNVKKAFHYSKFYSRSGEVLIEEYMEGPEVSVETLSIDGVCYVIQITDKLTTGAPYFVEMGHSEPSLLSEEIKAEIIKITKQAVKAIGIENGPSHTEIKITKNGPKIVEIGARLGGDNITTHLVPLSTGVDMVECCIKIALGEKPDFQIKYEKGAAIRYLKTKNGVINSIVGVEEAKEVSGVKQVSIVQNIGEEAKKIKSSVDRVGFVIAQCENVEKAIKSCETAIQKIEIKIGE
ncbi:ATP-grasp domain-containing protein [Clostridium perfringens]|nr:ATP-grasp domain-containing protein [Clostridium perfringens]